jgi:hypothetical protein
VEEVLERDVLVEGTQEILRSNSMSGLIVDHREIFVG